MKRILLIGGGYAGRYAAPRLARELRADEAEVTLADIGMPFRHDVVGLRSREQPHAACREAASR